METFFFFEGGGALKQKSMVTLGKNMSCKKYSQIINFQNSCIKNK